MNKIFHFSHRLHNFKPSPFRGEGVAAVLAVTDEGQKVKYPYTHTKKDGQKSVLPIEGCVCAVLCLAEATNVVLLLHGDLAVHRSDKKA